MRIAVISARYGQEIGGGAETLARGLLEELSRRGHHAEVWTTCARDNQTWENHFTPGSEKLNGVIVRRFEVDPWDKAVFEQLSAELLTKNYLPINKQFEWFECGPSSQALFSHVKQNQDNFDMVIAIPVISSLVFKAAWQVQNRLVVWPCLHDEIYSYFHPIHALMEKADGILFNSPEERDLALNTLNLKLIKNAVVGSGVDLPEFESSTPVSETNYLLYIGRLEEGKNIQLLIEYVIRFSADGSALNLKIAGTGNYNFPDHPAVNLLGYVNEDEKANLYNAALALCQPSINESFSLTMMESWLAGRPALVHKNCAVTRGHVQRARGGLWFETYGEFRGAVNWLLNHPELASRMGNNGRSYVQQNYTWPIVCERFLSTTSQWMQDW